MTSAIIMAAGKGTRMKSEKAKTMHKVLGKPMLEHINDTLDKIGVERRVIVVGHGKDEIISYFGERAEYAEQKQLLGSGHAVMQAEQLKNEKGKTLIINGDCPLITRETYEKMLDAAKQYPLVLLTVVLDDPVHYGRIVRNADNEVEAIVERKDCNEEQVKIKEINAGIYCVDNELLWKYIPELTDNNAQHEFYVTQLVEIFRNHGHKVTAVVSEDRGEMSGINTRKELVEATKWLQNRINNYWLDHGVTLVAPETTYISPDTVIGEDTVIYGNVRIEGHTTIGRDNEITEGSYFNNAVIGDGNVILSSRITDSEVEDNIKLGPWAHLRNGCHISSKARIGNFVEMKNTKFGYGSKCAHLTYVGDCEVGEDVNFGCGVVTVNYDGKHKFRTVIGNGCFIGSNVNLIAPIHIGDNAVIAAGSTVNHDVEPGDMAIARPRQENKPGYGLKYKNKK